MNLREELGDIDIYLLDQLLRERVAAGASVLDAGCGGGRNLYHFLRSGFDVSGADPEPGAIEAVRRLARSLGASDVEERFRVEPLETLSFENDRFDLVICNAVLHFARDEDHFRAMTDSLRRVARPAGLCFCRVASTIGIEDLVRPLEDAPPRWFGVPDGSQRFLVDLEFLLGETERLGVELADPVKTVNVQNRRCMTNWVWRKS